VATRTFVVAEAAACHDGDLDKALRLVDLAANIGADACKFQYLSKAEQLCARRRAPEYLAAYRLLELPTEWFPMLLERCKARGLELLMTCYLPEDVAVIAPYVTRFKVASFEATDAHFVALHAEWPEKPLIISAGMNADLRASLHAYRAARGCDDARPLPTVLHCVSAYPCEVSDLNLACLRYDPTRDPGMLMPQGLSDHSRHPWTGALAIAAGARVIEFHCRLEDTAPTNADYVVARPPAEAAEYVRNIRLAESMLGDGTRRVMPSEETLLRYRVGQSSA
jgi:sialic acid synthase SpsE